jgi:hypothetical protein
LDKKQNKKNSVVQEDDPFINNLAKYMKIPRGRLNIQIDGRPTLGLDFKGNEVNVDIQDASVFGIAEEEEKENQHEMGFFDKIKAAKNVAQIFDNHDLTVTIFRKGKKAVTMGKEASPSLSRLITRSDDIQIESFSQATKLGKEIEKSKKSEE